MSRNFPTTPSREYTLELSPQARVMNRWASRQSLHNASSSSTQSQYENFPQNRNFDRDLDFPDTSANDWNPTPHSRPISRELYLLHQFPTTEQYPVNTMRQVPAFENRHEISDMKRQQSEQLKEQDDELAKAEKARALWEKRHRLLQQQKYKDELDQHQESRRRLNERECRQDAKEESFFDSFFQKEDERRLRSRRMEQQLTEDAWNTYQLQQEEKRRQRSARGGDLLSSGAPFTQGTRQRVEPEVEVPVFTSSDERKQQISRQLARELQEENYKLMQERKKRNPFEAPQRYRASLI